MFESVEEASAFIQRAYKTTACSRCSDPFVREDPNNWSIYVTPNGLYCAFCAVVVKHQEAMEKRQ